MYDNLVAECLRGYISGGVDLFRQSWETFYAFLGSPKDLGSFITSKQGDNVIQIASLMGVVGFGLVRRAYLKKLDQTRNPESGRRVREQRIDDRVR
jgi:hypothetical protein